MVVQKTSVFPADRDSVFQKLQQLETLQIIAKPYAAFEPIGDTVSTWAVGDLLRCQGNRMDTVYHERSDDPRCGSDRCLGRIQKRLYIPAVLFAIRADLYDL